MVINLPLAPRVTMTILSTLPRAPFSEVLITPFFQRSDLSVSSKSCPAKVLFLWYVFLPSKVLEFFFNVPIVPIRGCCMHNGFYGNSFLILPWLLLDWWPLILTILQISKFFSEFLFIFATLPLPVAPWYNDPKGTMSMLVVVRILLSWSGFLTDTCVFFSSWLIWM